ncbi:hypothetical protein [Aureimonas psammosilenae]|uniref:hypothetical protein n=1 Tax=Aureimonas psammosilenae TaxID=2495496 RepID=UPI001260DAC3|nr:hypothetical protein [Aureimonas psammosilenae]
MKRGTIIAVMASLAWTIPTAAEPTTVPVGDWLVMTVRDWPPANRPACTVFHRSKSLSVFAAVEKNGATYVGVTAPTAKLTPAMFLDGSASLWFDGNEAVVVNAWPFDKLGAVIVSGRQAADGTDTIMTKLSQASRITLRAPGFEASVSPKDTKRAVELTQQCAALLPYTEEAVAQSTPSAGSLVGSWQVGPQTDPEIAGSCVMEQAADARRSIFAVIDDEGIVQVGLRNRDRFPLTPSDDPNIQFVFDKVPSTWHWSRLVTPEVVLTDTPYQSAEPGQLERELRAANRIEVRAKSYAATLTASATGEALDALRRCDSDTDTDEGDEFIIAEPPPTSPPAASQGTAAQAAPSGSGSEADRLGQAMGAMAGRSPTFAQYRCAFSVSQFTGILPINGKDDHGTLTLSIAEDGSGEMNGGRFQPVYADGSVANGDLRSVAYRVSDITAATNRSPEHAAPPLLYMTESEMAAYRFGMKYMQGLGQQMMAGRQRYMTVSLADDVVRFLDLTPQNQAANIATLECFRTQ